MNNNRFFYAASSEGSISLYYFNPKNGELTFKEKIITDSEPSFLSGTHDGKYLFVSLRDDNIHDLTSYKIDKKNGRLEAVNRITLKGERPVYITVDKSGKFLFYACIKGGIFSVIRINKNGILQEESEIHKISDFAHQIRIDLNNKYVYIPCFKSDVIGMYVFDEKKGTLSPNNPECFLCKKNTGPRHLDFHPNGKWLYILNELSNTVTFFMINDNGTLKVMQNISSLPAGFKNFSKTSDIHIDRSARFLYASNRGHDSIAVYGIDRKNGNLELIDIKRTMGNEPMNFIIDPSGNYLIVGNRSSDEIRVFKIDKKSGLLGNCLHVYTHPLPICHYFV
ncbi:MAG: lactonase family protein [Spirochaetes bacterium]|nr:lactonase family protein [Spirochaetota bacterium]